MQNRATYACTALISTNKMGIIKPDADGYYELVLGALNVFNSAGAYYPMGPAKELFAASSSLMRRIASGALKSEYGHPKYLPGMTDRDFLERVMSIYEDNVCSHIREVTIVDGVRGPDGGSNLAIIGKVKPSGPHATSLKASLDNPHENVSFSIRSITDDEIIGGRRIKNLKSIVTWDYVNEPGIAVANKFSAPTLEALKEFTFSRSQLNAVAERQASRGQGMESGIILASDIEREMGWARGHISAAPRSSRW